MIGEAGWSTVLLSWLLDRYPTSIHIEGMAKTSKPNPGKSRGRCKAPGPNGARLPIRISVDREALNALDKRAIAAQAGIGIIAGWLASWLVGGSGLLHYVVTGLAGSLVGSFLLERFGIDLGIRNHTASRIATATIGAMIVVLLARIIG
jgi:uncharacterized membrane protein YeaQ/YmgE (transglycosylase-associated protein family)